MNHKVINSLCNQLTLLFEEEVIPTYEEEQYIIEDLPSVENYEEIAEEKESIEEETIGIPLIGLLVKSVFFNSSKALSILRCATAFSGSFFNFKITSL